MSNLDVLKVYRIVYLATPYRKHPKGIVIAYIHTCHIAGDLAKEGIGIFSPIAHGHSLATHGNINPTDNDFWVAFNTPFMEVADALLVVKMVSWEVSDGIKEEIAFFMNKNKPIYFYDPNTMEISSYVS